KIPIRIGFPYESHPRIYRNEKGQWTGIHVDLWKLFAEPIGSSLEFAFPDFQHFGTDDPDGVNGKFVAGVMGLLQNDSIDAAMGDYTLQKGRMTSFQYTPQYDYQPMNLIRRQRVMIPSFFERIGEFISSFGVYGYVISSSLIIATSELIILDFRKVYKDMGTKTYGIKFCIVFNVFVAFTLFNAIFAGSNLLSSVQVHQETLSETLHQLSKDNATLIVRDITHLLGYANDTPSEGRITVLRTKKEVIARVCSDPNAIYFDYLRDFIEFYNGDISEDESGACNLRTVSNDINKEDKYTIGTSLGKPMPIVNYYLADRIRDKKKLAFVILGMFDADKIDSFWFPRYMGRPAMIPPDPPAEYTYTPFSLNYFVIFFALLGVGSALSVIVFLLEILWHRHRSSIVPFDLRVVCR
ncbi:hypothetical protein PMAYCL1PPCAC_23185, partial [Pristionchus mayeri]